MIRTWSVLAVAGLFAVVFSVPLAAMMSDEPTPAAVADLATLAKRVSDLEQRVRDLESRMPAQPSVASAPAAEDLPVLEIHSETWCGRHGPMGAVFRQGSGNAMDGRRRQTGGPDRLHSGHDFGCAGAGQSRAYCTGGKKRVTSGETRN